MMEVVFNRKGLFVGKHPRGNHFISSTE